ncbi:MAG TPA: rhodanese-like domain-containing protein [Steroidobacteraceae bacterium]
MRPLPLPLPLLLLTFALAFPAQADESATIEPQALIERLAWGDQALVVLDVRTAAEYEEGHVPGAQNIPHTELAARIAELSAAQSSDIVVYCRSGARAAQALAVLESAGFRRLFHLQGDYTRWSAESRPVIRPQ